MNMKPNGLRKQAKQLEQQAADMEQKAKAKEEQKKENWRAFWYGDVAPKLIFILGVLTLLVISGRCNP